MSVDAHLHLWDPAVLRYPWLDAEPDLGAAFRPGDAASPRVDRIVFVQAGADDAAAEAAWVQSLANGWPALAGIVAGAPVEEPDDLARAIDALARVPLLRGVRRLLQDEPPELLVSPGLQRGLRRLGEHGLPFDACVRHPQLDDLAALAASAPGTVVVLDHIGKPPVAAGFAAADGWRAAVARLAALPNTVVKLSGLAPEAHAARPLRPQVEPFLRFALDAFGPRRAMAGSDFPVSRVHGLTYDGWFALLDEVLALAGAEREAVFSATAERVYRLE